MSTKNKIIIIVVIAATSFAVGRYTVPVKTVTQIKTVEVEKKTDKTEDKLNTKAVKHTVIVENKKPDGTDTITTTITEKTGTNEDKDTVDKSSVDETKSSTKEVVKDSGHLSISALAGVNPFNQTTNPGLVYGVHAHKDLIGPISVGLWGLNNGTLGCSVGLTF